MRVRRALLFAQHMNWGDWPCSDLVILVFSVAQRSTLNLLKGS